VIVAYFTPLGGRTTAGSNAPGAFLVWHENYHKPFISICVIHTSAMLHILMAMPSSLGWISIFGVQCPRRFCVSLSWDKHGMYLRMKEVQCTPVPDGISRNAKHFA